MTKEEFTEWAVSRGYQHRPEDKKGRFSRRASDGNIYSFKVTEHSVRYEARVLCVQEDPDRKPKKRWVRIASNYLDCLHIDEEGKLVGLSVNTPRSRKRR